MKDVLMRMDRDISLCVQPSTRAVKPLICNKLALFEQNGCLFPVNISSGFCYVLQLSMEHTSSVFNVFNVSVLCVLVLLFVLGNYVAVVRWFLCPGCLAPCKSQVLLKQVHVKHQIQCLVFHDGLIVSVCVIVWVSVVPMGTLFHEIGLVACLFAVPFTFLFVYRKWTLKKKPNDETPASLWQSVPSMQNWCSIQSYCQVAS